MSVHGHLESANDAPGHQPHTRTARAHIAAVLRIDARPDGEKWPELCVSLMDDGSYQVWARGPQDHRTIDRIAKGSLKVYS